VSTGSGGRASPHPGDRWRQLRRRLTEELFWFLLRPDPPDPAAPLRLLRADDR